MSELKHTELWSSLIGERRAGIGGQGSEPGPTLKVLAVGLRGSKPEGLEMGEG